MRSASLSAGPVRGPATVAGSKPSMMARKVSTTSAAEAGKSEFVPLQSLVDDRPEQFPPSREYGIDTVLQAFICARGGDEFEPDPRPLLVHSHPMDGSERIVETIASHPTARIISRFRHLFEVQQHRRGVEGERLGEQFVTGREVVLHGADRHADRFHSILERTWADPRQATIASRVAWIIANFFASACSGG